MLCADDAFFSAIFAAKYDQLFSVALATPACDSELVIFAAMLKPVILWVEDNHQDVLLLRTAFLDAGLDADFIVADNAIGAFRYLDAREPFHEAPRPPDLVLVDLNLPAIRGQAVLKEARRHSIVRGVPMVVLTSSADPRELRACTDLGAVECITKPATMDGYDAVVRRLRRYLPNEGTGNDRSPQSEADPASSSDQRSRSPNRGMPA